MIIKKREHWFRMLFVIRGSVLPQILPRLLMLFLLSVLVVYFRGILFHQKIPLNPAPFTLFGIALALFLGFRNSASYDRFWEARKLWGALVFQTRSLARQALTLCDYPPQSKEPAVFIQYLIAFTYALKHQLRQTDASADLERIIPGRLAEQLKPVIFKPVLLLKEMGLWIQEAKTNGKIDSIQQASFDDNLNKLCEILTGCERIANTPIPYTYSIILHRTVYFYCFMLPFGFVDSLGWITPVVVTFIAYTFVALEALADEIEEPFGMAPNDLALDTMSNTIERTLHEMNGAVLEKAAEPTGYFIT